MPGRLLGVTARTTLDFVDAVVLGHDFETETHGIVDATADREDPDHVRLGVELDNLTEEHLPAHAQTFELTPEQARELAADLEKHADRVEQAQGDAVDG